MDLPPARALFIGAAYPRLCEETTLHALQISCTDEVYTVPNLVSCALLKARLWILKVSRLETAVSELPEHEHIPETDRGADHRDGLDKIRAVQDLLAIIGQRTAEPDRSRSILDADANYHDIRSSGQTDERRRRD